MTTESAFIIDIRDIIVVHETLLSDSSALSFTFLLSCREQTNEFDADYEELNIFPSERDTRRQVWMLRL